MPTRCRICDETHTVGFVSTRLSGTDGVPLEAACVSRPIVVNTYAIYTVDIRPKGFEGVEMDGYVTGATMRRARKVLRERMVGRNHRIAARRFSCAVLR